MTVSNDAKPPAAPPAPPVGRWIAVGLVVSAVMFGGFGSWAALAPLSSASMAPGIVKVDSNRKTVQHYEGGIIREILVRDGDEVKQGQVLVRLDDLDARADSSALRGQLDALRAREARLIAQRDGLDFIALPESLLARSDDRDVAMIVEGQRRIFDDQARALDAEIAVLRQRIERFRAQIAAYQAENTSLSQQLVTLEDEHAAAAKLLADGFERRSRVLELERNVSAARGDIAANEQRIVAVGEEIAEANLQITSLREERARAVSEELREVQTRAAELEQQMHKSDAQVGRKDLVAPQDGVVVNSRYFTSGGVIAPGAEVMDIVPAEDSWWWKRGCGRSISTWCASGCRRRPPRRLQAAHDADAQRHRQAHLGRRAQRRAHRRGLFPRQRRGAAGGTGARAPRGTLSRHAGRRGDRHRRAHAVRLSRPALHRQPRPRLPRGLRRAAGQSAFSLAAIAEISILTSRGSRATCTVARAGGASGKNSA
jgi:HlyD family type I secretion membrane fusion protein